MKKKSLVIILVAFLILLILAYYEGPRFAPSEVYCGECSIWEFDHCAINDCGLHFAKFSRYCEISEVARNLPSVPKLSPIPAECLQQCEFVPDICNFVPEVSLESPISGSIDFDFTDIILNWSASDTENDSLKYDLYFGSDINPQLYKSNLVEDTYLITDNLLASTTYYWKVIVKDGYNSTSSAVWNFTTHRVNAAPNVSLLNPLNNSNNLSLDVIFVWSGSDDDGDDLSYALYLGNDLLTVTDANFFEVNDLSYGTTYSWRVDVSDAFDLVSSNTFYFSTREAPDIPVTPPSSGDSTGSDEEELCASGCYDNLIGNGVCDSSCNVGACGYDNGDCSNSEEDYTLFDIKVFLEGDYPQVAPGATLDADIVLYNFGTVRPVDVFLNCSIQDVENKDIILDYFYETLAVSVQTSIERSLTVPDYTPSGRYVYNCYMTYSSSEDPITSGDLFEVVVPEEQKVSSWWDMIYWFVYHNWWYLLFIILVLAIIIYLLFLLFGKKKKKKRKRKR